MNRTMKIGAAALLATFAAAMTAAPTSAGSGFSVEIGSGHYGHGWGHGPHGGVTFGFNSERGSRHIWRKHVRWCFNHHASYDPGSNRYFNGHRWRRCHSPFI